MQTTTGNHDTSLLQNTCKTQLVHPAQTVTNDTRTVQRPFEGQFSLWPSSEKPLAQGALHC